MNDVLSGTLRNVRLGRAVSHGPLHIFPLVGGDEGDSDFPLLEEALESGSLTARELEGGGSVPELRVENKGSVPVLILEGDEFLGFKQNRVVNSSVLVAARAEISLSVSCVEQGRWSRRSRPFSSGKSSPHLSLRRLKSRSVHDSLRSGRGHRSDQSAVWEEIDRISARHEAPSPTRALEDARASLVEKLSEYGHLSEKMPKEARGAVVSLGGMPVALEILAGPKSFAKAFPKLLSGYALEALGHEGSRAVPDPFTAGDLIEAALSAKRSEHPAVGAGFDLRLESEDVSGYALVEGGRVLHAAVFAEGRGAGSG